MKPAPYGPGYSKAPQCPFAIIEALAIETYVLERATTIFLVGSTRHRILTRLASNRAQVLERLAEHWYTADTINTVRKDISTDAIRRLVTAFRSSEPAAHRALNRWFSSVSATFESVLLRDELTGEQRIALGQAWLLYDELIDVWEAGTAASSGSERLRA